MVGTTVPSGFTRMSTLPDSGLIDLRAGAAARRLPARRARGTCDRSWVVAMSSGRSPRSRAAPSRGLPELDRRPAT